ncbi:hypothetical protein A2837_01865 [Candidatus Kaiserbacteria bacterium RIFCSPHIGHO2_01_FULL_46_22]|uniref:Uncharacterized protein n=1 Tax=Candidatus Kaiserbacteria bacterium RIFCSPHIGHO2_01_FULL_46_22 TaxID=1798475 RepID=A0A1F6BYN1_9BACT|nr:MAG: hypothetical protein A2837_01865 [Candidatus Kaiserbacteria bacterium RIFCSPHIGHO2_01_FULL_46_22]
MDYDFGDILDARNAPDGHFIVVVGEATKQGQTEVMYYIITSRVYAVFKDILAFFNDCLSRGDKDFLKHFSKEKAKTAISAHGLLSQAVFLDKQTNYDTCLDVESMIVVNSDPKLIDKTALESLRGDGKVIYRNKLAKIDALNLIQIIKHSNEVSPDRKNKMSASFNKIKSTLR